MKVSNRSLFTAVLSLGAMASLAAPARADWVTNTVAVGETPHAVAVNPVTNKIYVTNRGSATVTVIDGATNDTATVAVGENPNAVAVNPVTNKIYVTNRGSATVTVIDGATYGTATVAVGENPNAVAVNPVANKIYVINEGSATVTVIDGATNGTTNVAVGNVPCAMAVNPVTNKIYVVNYGSNTVTVIDGATNGTATVAVGENPLAVAVNPVTNKIYVTNYGNNTVTVIDGATNVTATVTAGSGPWLVAVNPVTNKIYVANYGSNTVTVIDGTTNSTATVTAGSGPWFVAVNPVTNKIYVANHGSNTVTVIDGVTNDTNTVAVGETPRYVAVNPVTNKIYVTNQGSATVTVIDGASYDTATVAVGINNRNEAVNPVTNKIYVANFSSNTVTVIDGATNSTATITAGSEPWFVAVNPVTNKIYVANSGSNTVTVIDGATNSTTTVAVGSLPDDMAVNPVTNKIYVVNCESQNVTVIDGATNSTTNVAVGNVPCAVAVNPVTNKIYVANASSNTVTVIDGATNGATTTAVGSHPYAVAVNPVTNKIYVTNRGSATVTVIDGATNGTATVAVGNDPYAVAVNPVTNKIYVANRSTATVTVIDGATNGTTTLSVGSEPYAVAVNPVTNRFYVSNSGSGTVSVIDEVLEWETGLLAVMDYLPNHACYGKQPDLFGTAMMNWSPNASPITMVINDWMTGQDSHWNQATIGIAKIQYTNWQYNWGNDSLLWGENYVNIVPLEMQAATGNNLGLGTPMAGNMLTYPIYYLDNAGPSQITLVSPANDTIARDSLFIFVWNAASDNYGIGVYHFKIWASDTVDTTVSDTCFSLKLDISDTLYRWQVSAIDVCGNEGPGSEIRALRLDFLSPDVPNLISPWNNAWCSDTTMICVWTEVAKKNKGAPVEYVIQLDTVNSFVAPLFEDTTANILDTFNLDEGKYYWRVKAFDLAGNFGTYSNSRMFGIDTTAPLFMYVKSLPDDSTAPYGPYEVICKVIDLSGVDQAYLFIQINDGSWDSTAMFYSADSLRDTIGQLNPTANETLSVSYYIKAKDLLGHWRNSSAYSFNAVGPLGVAGTPLSQAPLAFALNRAYPNPSRGWTSFKYQLPKTSSVKLDIYNIAGQLIKEFDEGTRGAGYHSILWSTTGISNGIYFCRLRAGAFTATKSFTVLK